MISLFFRTTIAGLKTSFSSHLTRPPRSGSKKEPLPGTRTGLTLSTFTNGIIAHDESAAGWTLSCAGALDAGLVPGSWHPARILKASRPAAASPAAYRFVRILIINVRLVVIG